MVFIVETGNWNSTVEETTYLKLSWYNISLVALYTTVQSNESSQKLPIKFGRNYHMREIQDSSWRWHAYGMVERNGSICRFRSCRSCARHNKLIQAPKGCWWHRNEMVLLWCPPLVSVSRHCWIYIQSSQVREGKTVWHWRLQGGSVGIYWLWKLNGSIREEQTTYLHFLDSWDQR
jgi:hypothetical protein